MKIDTPWGPLGYIVYKRTYARPLASGKTEEFEQTIERIVDASEKQLSCGFSEEEKKELSSHLLSLKCSVAGRFLWQLGTKTVDRLGLLSLQNCAAVVVDHPIRPFTWAMDALMLGSGVGYNIQREYVYELPKVKAGPTKRAKRVDTKDADFIVPDSREGWVELLNKTLSAYYITGKAFTYSTICIRGKGTPIKSFGGTASGPEELCQGIEWICGVLDKRRGKKVRPIDCLDIMNILGFIVVAGNVRRSAQIAIGDCDDLQYLKAKNWSDGNIPNWRAMSNNSVVCNDIGMLPDDFWKTYDGSSEPYGLINIALSRKVGRIGESQYPDPDVSAYNPCVSGDTLILTDKGHIAIEELVNTPATIWNGFEWSEVVPKVTGHNQPMLNIKLSNGKELKCTYAHKWILSNKERVSAVDLRIGDSILKHKYPVIEQQGSNKLESAYTQGFYSGDGDTERKIIWLYSPKYECEPRLLVKDAPAEYDTRNPEIKRKLLRPAVELKDKNWVPDVSHSLQDRLDWFAGVCDADANVTKDGNLQLSSIDEKFLKEVQMMLTTCGVDSKIAVMHKAGKRHLPGGEYYCQQSYRLMLSAVSVKTLYELGMVCNRLKLEEINPNRDASRFVKIAAIEDAGMEETVYCFTEHKRNYGIFNGILTGQCAEQSLASFETCCLAEIYLPNIKSYDELLNVISYMYRINKHSLRLPCHHKGTENIVHKNMRMGIGMTGILEASKEQRSWLSKAYEWLREYDRQYSEKMGWPKSIKLTTVKPSGTLSLLAGVTSGIHPGYSRYYIRRVRISSDSPLVDVCRKHGYHVEPQRNFDGTDDHNTMVVSFPCKHPKHTVLAKDVTAIDQLEYVKGMQADWSDNAVSCTVYYKKEELEDVKAWLKENYNDNVKSCSFLLHMGHGFDQAPLEEIDEDKYNQLISSCTPITSVEIKEKDMQVEECEGGHCPIK